LPQLPEAMASEREQQRQELPALPQHLEI